MQFPDWLDITLKIIGLVGGLLGAIGGGAVWVARQTLVTQDDLRERFEEHEEDHKKLDERLVAGELQFATIQADLGHLPDHQDIFDIRERISAVEGEVKALGATIDGLKEVLERIERPLNVIVEKYINGGSK